MCNETFTKFLCKTISLCLATFIYLSLEMIMKLVETQFAFLLQDRRETGVQGGCLQGIVIFLTVHSWYHHTQYQPLHYRVSLYGRSFNKYVIWKGGRENEEINRKLYRIKEGVQSKK